jgi:hypothetical protein
LIYPLKMMIFHSSVSLPEGRSEIPSGWNPHSRRMPLGGFSHYLVGDDWSFS